MSANPSPPCLVPPPADPEPRPDFDKLSSTKSGPALRPHRRRSEHSYDEAASRREDWLVAGVLLLALAVGGWLIVSGLV